MLSPKEILFKLKQQVELLNALKSEYENKNKGLIYSKRLSAIHSRIESIKVTLENLGKRTINIYIGEFEDGDTFEFLYDSSVPENEVIGYIEFLQLKHIKWYKLKGSIKTGVINFHKKK